MIKQLSKLLHTVTIIKTDKKKFYWYKIFTWSISVGYLVHQYIKNYNLSNYMDGLRLKLAYQSHPDHTLAIGELEDDRSQSHGECREEFTN